MAMDLRDYFHRRCSETLVMEREETLDVFLI